jgi:hypothetical protein
VHKAQASFGRALAMMYESELWAGAGELRQSTRQRVFVWALLLPRSISKKAAGDGGQNRLASSAHWALANFVRKSSKAQELASAQPQVRFRGEADIDQQAKRAGSVENDPQRTLAYAGTEPQG